MSFTRDFNQGVRERSDKLLDKTLDYALQMGVLERGELFKRARTKVKYRDNEAELIQLIMPRHAFVQMTEGGLGSTASQVGGKRRLSGGTPRPFARKAVEERQQELADYVAEMFADETVRGVDIGVRY